MSSLRHAFLMYRLVADRIGDDAIRDVNKAKQEALAGTALPTTFPSYDALAAVGYTMVEDLDGSDSYELTQTAGITTSQADAVIAALAEL